MIDINIYNLLGVAVLGNMIAYDFTPIQPVKRKLLTLLRSSMLEKLFGCSKCVSFWLSLILFHSIPLAALAGFIGFLINFINDRINYWYES